MRSSGFTSVMRKLVLHDRFFLHFICRLFYMRISCATPTDGCHDYLSACLILVQRCDPAVCRSWSVSLGSGDVIPVIALISFKSNRHFPDSYNCSDLMDQRSHFLKASSICVYKYMNIYIYIYIYTPSFPPCHFSCIHSRCGSHFLLWFMPAKRNHPEKRCHVRDRNDLQPNL